MDIEIIVDPAKEEKVIIFTHQRTPLVEKIEQLVRREPLKLVGFRDEEGVILEYVKVSRFTVENGKTYAYVEGVPYWIKHRLYQVEEQMPDCFVKLHQSCLANLGHIARFKPELSGTLRVEFKDGGTEYVSRRNVRNVKERLGV